MAAPSGRPCGHATSRTSNETRDRRPAGFRQGRAGGLSRPRRRVAGVFCAPDKEGAKPDPLKVAARGAQRVACSSSPRSRAPTRSAAMRSLDVDIGVMAYVLQFAPQDFVTIPPAWARSSTTRRCCRCTAARARSTGRSSAAKRRTGLTIFRPTDGLDEGPVILQKEAAIGPDDTLGSVYFDRLFPHGRRGDAGGGRPRGRGQAQGNGAGRVAGELRRLVPRRRSEDLLARARRPHLRPDPRLQSRARRMDHARRKEAPDLRCAQAPDPHVRRRQGQDRRNRGDRRRRAFASRPTAARSKC